MIKLYDFLESGNGFKVRLLLHLLKKPYQLIEKNILEGETKDAAFLKINPNGKIPAIELEDGRCLTESNAILFFLANGSNYLPNDPWVQAQVMSWLFFEQYSHEPNIAVARFWKHFVDITPDVEEQLKEKHEKGYEALSIMEDALAENPDHWLVGSHMTIADIALYAYTHVSEEGGFDLSGYPEILKWIQKIASFPFYVPITYNKNN